MLVQVERLRQAVTTWKSPIKAQTTRTLPTVGSIPQAECRSRAQPTGTLPMTSISQ
jgi:hypothetical protein